MSDKSVKAAAFLAVGLFCSPMILSPQPASAQERSPSSVGDVEVQGRRLRQQVQSFIQEAAAPPPGRRLARWNRKVCVGVTNMDARYAQLMLDRIATISADVGIDMGTPGCKPDVMVVMSADAGALARALVEDDPRGFRPSTSATDLGPRALELFQSTEAPVRWWHVSLPVTVDTGQVAIELVGEHVIGREGHEPLIVPVRNASRVRSNVREDLARVIIVIDVAKVGQVGFGALSDYVAMVALAQLSLDADTSKYNTVLNLFADGSDRLAGLTQWDKDYLKSLYTARNDLARATQQSEDILRGMTGQRDTRIRAENDDR